MRILRQRCWPNATAKSLLQPVSVFGDRWEDAISIQLRVPLHRVTTEHRQLTRKLLEWIVARGKENIDGHPIDESFHYRRNPPRKNACRLAMRLLRADPADFNDKLLVLVVAVAAPLVVVVVPVWIGPQ